MAPPSPLRLALGTSGLLVAIALIGWLDYVTGAEIGFSLLYLLPVVAAGWRLGTPVGSLAAAAAAVAWFAADAAWYPTEHLPITAWNAFTRLVIFAVLASGADRMRSDREELLSLNQKLRELLDREQALARTDALTGLANARSFGERLAVELARARRSGAAVCVAYIDIDNFKAVNDRFGHAAGDELLRRTASLIQQSLRAGDLSARLGGDEFGVALWEVERAAAEAVAKRLVWRVGEFDTDYPGAGVGASIGIAFLEAPPASVDEALRVADAAMYVAKEAGKGRVAVSGGVGAAATLLARDCTASGKQAPGV